MVSVNGVTVPKLDTAIPSLGSIEPASPVRDKVASERSEARTAGAEGKSFHFEQMSEQDKEQLQEMLDKHNEQFAYTGKYLKFKFDEEASMMYVEVIDAATQEVIVSLPPEFLIDLSVKMKKILGLYIDEKL